MKKALLALATVCSVILMTDASAKNSDMNPKRNLDKIEKAAEAERRRQEEYKKVTGPKGKKKPARNPGCDECHAR